MALRLNAVKGAAICICFLLASCAKEDHQSSVLVKSENRTIKMNPHHKSFKEVRSHTLNGNKKDAEGVKRSLTEYGNAVTETEASVVEVLHKALMRLALKFLLLIS
ncbi:hypothetical protein [Roseinatronobacter monicus]|uniref:Lipoprotein n=1 Tax=Roseinatronobacter monicus TaxID=393481 RepID=A0A543K8Z1_9RHOB|nr:hypothetical protein [Roseinatronobacter monicus]TQM91514.1 hypothetical protein BD293_0068 [Roseinatronobacter monicus]